MGLSRSDVYIGNIMNWRPEVPKGNRPPTEEEMRYCLPYLKAQIEIVNPQIVVALGMTAVNGLLGPDPARRMGKIRGHWHSFEGRDLMITYHPSFLLQYASAAMKRLVWEDMMAVMERAGMAVSAAEDAAWSDVVEVEGLELAAFFLVFDGSATLRGGFCIVADEVLEYVLRAGFTARFCVLDWPSVETHLWCWRQGV